MNWLAANPIKTVLVIALVGALAWGARVDHLRARYLDLLTRITIAIPDRPKPDKAPEAIAALVKGRDDARTDRDAARLIVKQQSASIDALAAETDRLVQLGVEQRRLAEATIRQRDEWIRRAQAAETRTERLSAETEMEECNAVLDALYHDGF
ncbi:hypothetical protein [Sphingomonas sp. IW22]|uniref:hypothetical protein n=1 Tax=Sphingomonas sp. IW22 TaxID=3242489 RepID=UPI0035205662